MNKLMFNDKFSLTKAVLEGRKTQTRRLADPKQEYERMRLWQPCLELEYGPYGCTENDGWVYIKPQYHLGEVVAIAQSYSSIIDELENCRNATCAEHYESNQRLASLYNVYIDHPGFNNKLFVASDKMIHQIRITDVRVERLQDISDECCLKEGIIKKWHAPACKNYYYVPGIEVKSVKDVHDTPQEAFAHLINKVSRKDVWERNPYVFVYDFELVK